MEIWVSVDKNGFLDGYSLNEQPDQIKVEVEKIPADFTNWKLEGSKLVHDPENAPIVEGGLTETELLREENEKLKKELEVTKEDLANTQLGLAEVYEMLVPADAAKEVV